MSNLSFGGGSGRSETLGRSSGDGTTVTSGGSSGTKGSYTSLGTTSFDWDGFTLMCSGMSASRPCQYDVAVGATPDIIVADGFFFPFDSTYVHWQHFPVRVPANTALKMRCAVNTNGNAQKWIATGYQGDHLLRGFRKAANLNTFSGAEPVTKLTESGTTQTAWTQLIASTADRYGALIVQPPDVTGTGQGGCVILEFGIGSSGAEQSIGSLAVSSNVPQRCVGQGFLLCDIPLGSRIAFRVQAANAGTPSVAPSVLGLVL